MRKLNFRSGVRLLLLVTALMFGALISSSPASRAGEMETLPGPQLVTNAWMFIAGFKADPEALKALLPEGLEPHPDNRVVINMYTVPNGQETSGFGAYTLTYLTVEVADNDSYTMGQPTGYPGRYFIYYFNDSPLMRDFTSKIGIPAQPGHTNISTDTDGNFKAVLSVDGTPLIEATAKVGNVKSGVVGGHLNYFGLLQKQKGEYTLNQVVKYPIPWIGSPVSTENAAINFVAPADHPLQDIAPQQVDWAVWIQSSFVYPQHQVIHQWLTKDGKKIRPQRLYR